MAFDNTFTAVTGATYTAAQYNTYVRDNFTAVWVGTTAGDIEYYTGAAAKARIAAPAALALLKHNATLPSWLSAAGSALKYLRVNSDVSDFEFAGGGVKAAILSVSPNTDSGGASWRDVTGATKTVTVDVTSTILCIGWVTKYPTDTPNYYGYFSGRFMIDGTEDSAYQIDTTYGNGQHGTPILGFRSGVTAGSKVCKLRESCSSGSYKLVKVLFAVLTIPE